MTLNIGDMIVLKKVPTKYIHELCIGDVGVIEDIKYGSYMVSFENKQNQKSNKGLFYFEQRKKYIREFNFKNDFEKFNELSELIVRNGESYVVSKEEFEKAFNKECTCMSFDDGEKKMEGKTMDNILEREMNIFNKGKEIIDRYKFYVREYYNQKCDDEINDLTNKSKVKEIIDKHKKQMVQEINELLSDRREVFIHYNDNSFDNFIYLTEEERKLEKEIKDKYNHVSNDVIKNIDRIKSSIDLCENRDQLMKLLCDTGFVDKSGVIIPHELIKGYLD